MPRDMQQAGVALHVLALCCSSAGQGHLRLGRFGQLPCGGANLLNELGTQA
jgi:hypothetical protein